MTIVMQHSSLPFTPGHVARGGGAANISHTVMGGCERPTSLFVGSIMCGRLGHQEFLYALLLGADHQCATGFTNICSIEMECNIFIKHGSWLMDWISYGVSFFLVDGRLGKRDMQFYAMLEAVLGSNGLGGFGLLSRAKAGT